MQTVLKIGDLKRLLNDLPDHYPLVITRHGQGSQAVPLVRAEVALYVPVSPWEGFVFPDADRPKLGDEAEYTVVLRPIV